LNENFYWELLGKLTINNLSFSDHNGGIRRKMLCAGLVENLRSTEHKEATKNKEQQREKGDKKCSTSSLKFDARLGR
jgi:hypothetical protein